MRTPRALLVQGASNHYDETMTQLARTGRPQRRWWWGVRRWCIDMSRGGDSTGDCSRFDDSDARWRTGAWCYLCDRAITTWSGRWPMTVDAKLAVQRHRAEHIQGRLDTSPTGDET